MFDKRSLGYKTYKAGVKIWGAQFTAIFVYYAAVLLVTGIGMDYKTGSMSVFLTLMPTLIAEIYVFFFSYRLAWNLGYDHGVDVHSGRKELDLRPCRNLGLISISPLILLWTLNVIFTLLTGKNSIFGTVLSYFLYPWSPYFEWILSAAGRVAWWLNLAYIPILAIIPIATGFGYKNGTSGTYEYIFGKNPKFKDAPAQPSGK